MVERLLGLRIRERRRQMGVTQRELAARLDISSSYLNLIERNKRRITETLLSKLSEALDLSVGELEGASEERLAGALTEIAYQPVVADLGVETERAPELIGRFPGWARALSALARSEHAAHERADVLSNRMLHDPYLGETVHRMLTRIAAVRSAAEILTEYDDVPQDQQAQFQTIIRDEAAALTEIGEALATYFDRSETRERRITPVDEAEALLNARENHFAEIEDCAEDPAARARCIRTLLNRTPEIETVAARNRAKRILETYADEAAVMPLHAFADRAEALRYDVEALAADFGTQIPSVCRRLAALPPADERPRFGYIQANAGGAILQLRNLPRLSVPRFAGVCPLWILHRAIETPGTMLRQHAIFPDGGRFVFVARARNTAPPGFGHPRHYVTDMVTLSEPDAAQTVYAIHAPEAEDVGPSCRTCARTQCQHRVADPLTG
ncbi:MAG: short-chain fatty acyl-CoA regulator family protein [Pseudomonadota bacterium]